MYNYLPGSRHLREQPEVRHDLVLSSEFLCVAGRRGDVTASLDREGTVQMDSDLSSL